MKLIVDRPSRYAKMRAHTATHLLHAELVKIFPNTKQAGSAVDDDLLRFDFLADRALTPTEIIQIEKNINQTIRSAYTMDIQEVPYKDAIKL